ncbi:MAG: hypothetical protein LC791_15730 [Acidobacteria bacterium]|nr:hypothetical protein [Acidobacteriota bacterium]
MRVFAALLAAACVGGSVSAQPGPLPDAETFFARARERLASNELLQNRYAFKERRTDIRLNPLGHMGTGPLLLYEVYPSVEPAMTYRRLIQRDGTPVAEAELTAQDDAYRRRYHEWRLGLSRENPDERAVRRKRQAATEAKAHAQAKEMVELFAFSIERRDTWEGEPAIVVGFAAKPQARPRTRESRVAVVFAGKAWVHETEHEVMHLEATTIDDVSFGFGMVAKLNEGAKTSMTRRRVNQAWLPAETRFSGNGRALLLRKVAINYVREYFDYRPFDPNDPPPIPGLASASSR